MFYVMGNIIAMIRGKFVLDLREIYRTEITFDFLDMTLFLVMKFLYLKKNFVFRGSLSLFSHIDVLNFSKYFVSHFADVSVYYSP